MSHVFSRALRRDLPVAVRAEGALLWDADGRRYIDGAGGAIAVGIGHGVRSVADAMASQAARLAYAHATEFTTEPLEAYADELAPLLPLEEPRIFPVSGGSEATESALKMARAYHLANGEPSRHKVIARWGSYHGNTLGALDASGREPLRRPYAPWLGRAIHVPAAYEYRCPLPTHPDRCGTAHAALLDEAIRREGPDSVACFIAEPISGATLGGAVPPEDYWPAVAEVCRRHGVLVIADEVMTGFGRTGTWFAMDHWDVRPDILVAAKGASSAYWPFGFAAASGRVFDTIASGGFTHGFTYSHNAVGAAVAREVLRVLVEQDLVEASRVKGDRLQAMLRGAIGEHPHVGDIRGRGLMVGVELVADPQTRAPFPRSERVTERVCHALMERGLILYSSTGCANGTDGDLIMFGPPFVIRPDELEESVTITAAALDATLSAAAASA